MSQTEQPPIANPTAEEVRAIADRYGLGMSASDIDVYTGFLGAMTDNYRVVAELETPPRPVKYPRSPGAAPDPADNPYNAWYWKCTIDGAASGKLEGRTVAIKDNICVAGIPAMNGSRLMEGFVPLEDATVVTRVLDAGGQILGKATCENLCFSGGSHTCASGPVRNPRNPEFMSGGSSSGCAALLVAGEVDLAVGGDQGGSIRMPSSFSGCYGIKPTYGLVPYTGALAIENTIDHLGPMANSTADCALLLEVLAGYDDGLDPRQPLDLEPKAYSQALTGDARGLKVGILREGFDMPGAERDVSDMVDRAARRLSEQGATVADISVPLHHQAPAIFFAAVLETSMMNYTDECGASANNAGYYALDAVRFYHEQGKQRFAELPPTVRSVILFGAMMRKRYGNYYSAKARNLVRTLRAAYDQALADCDVFVMPTTQLKAHRITPPDASDAAVMAVALDMTVNTCPFDVTGHPSMSVPAGMSDGLPVGLMITGRRGEDDVVLRVGHAFEQLGMFQP